MADFLFSFKQTDASDVEIIFNHYISAIAYEPQTKKIPNMNAYRLDSDGTKSY